MRAVIVSGGVGGVFYPYGQILASLLSASVPALAASGQMTRGSVDNARFIHRREADIGFSTLDSAYDAIHGTGAFAADGKLDLCVLAVLYDSYLHIVAAGDKGISRISDLKGRRVSVGSTGSSTETIADRVMEAAGLHPHAEIERFNFGVAESADALKSGRIDAFFWIGGLPTAAVSNLAASGTPKLVFLPTENLEAIDKAYPGLYRPASLPKTTYAGMTEDVPSLEVANVLIVSSKAEPRFVTTVLEGIFANVELIRSSHPEAKKLSLETAGLRTAVPFHPAAEAFYAEKGALK
ncbi:C4-dicarboxylate ABC transporter substrate-binding protein [Kaistia sp. 32K]|nr:C4-dicarboxylate ABC transporter substrate-binding protein [Kaistia sp. 32K]